MSIDQAADDLILELENQLPNEETAWPKYAIMKGFTMVESKMTSKEKNLYPELFQVEKMLQFLDKTVKQHFSIVSKEIDRMRLTRNLKQAKISSFIERCHNSFNFFKETIPMLKHLSTVLFEDSASKSLTQLFNTNFGNLISLLSQLAKHYDSHILIKLSNQTLNVRVLFAHLLKFKTNFEEVNATFSSTLGPLNVVFSSKLKPIIEVREAFFVAQMMNVAERGAKISQIRQEMQEMIERRQRLEVGTNNLDRMFDILLKFKDSIQFGDNETYF